MSDAGSYLPEMSAAEVAAALSERKWRGRDDWRVETGPHPDLWIVSQPEDRSCINPWHELHPEDARAIVASFHLKAELTAARTQLHDCQQIQKWASGQAIEVAAKRIAELEQQVAEARRLFKLTVQCSNQYREQRDHAVAALRLIYDNDDSCECDDHTSGSCCFYQEEFCGHCYAGAALAQPAGATEPPCALCGGPHLFDTSVDSDLWNAVIRARELPEYLCMICVVREFARAGKGFTAKLWGAGFQGLPVKVSLRKGDNR